MTNDRPMDWTMFPIVLDRISDVQDFVELVEEAKHPVVVTNKNGYRVDGKSLMGMFSIDPSKGVEVTLDDEDLFDDLVAFLRYHRDFCYHKG